MTSHPQRCETCKDVIPESNFYYVDSRGKKMCIHCIAEYFKKGIQFVEEIKLNAPMGSCASHSSAATEREIVDELIIWLTEEVRSRRNAVFDRTQGYHDAFEETLQKIEELPAR